MAAPKKSTKKSTPQVMDVSKPGKTPPSSTSKPIIVGHGPRVGDPMVSDKPSGDSSDEKGSEPVKIQVSRTSPKVIKPLSELDKKDVAPAVAGKSDPKSEETEQDSDKPYVITVTKKPSEEKSAPELDPAGVTKDERKDEPDQTADEQKAPESYVSGAKKDNPDETKADEKAETPPESSEPAEAEKADLESQPDNSDETETDNPSEAQPETKDSLTEDVPSEDETEDKPDESDDFAEQAAEETATVNAVASKTRDRSAESKEAEEERKRQEHIAQLIQNKKYFLPIKQSRKHRRKKNILLVILLVMLAVAGLAAANGWLDISSVGFPGGLSSEDQSQETAQPQPVAEDASTEQEEEAAEPDAQSEAKDTERKTDIDTIATNLDGYFAQFGRFPTLVEINDKAFRTENLKSMPEESLKDPDGTEMVLAEKPAENVYSYATLPEDCDNQELVCASYTLTATLSDGETYQKQTSQ